LPPVLVEVAKGRKLSLELTAIQLLGTVQGLFDDSVEECGVGVCRCSRWRLVRSGWITARNDMGSRLRPNWRWRSRRNGSRWRSGGQGRLRRFGLGRAPDLRRRGRCRWGFCSGRELRLRSGGQHWRRRFRLGAGVARPAPRLEPRNELTSSGRAEVGVPICPPQRLAGPRCIGIAPVAHLARRALRAFGTAQLDQARGVAVPASVNNRCRRVPVASCTKSKRQERLCPQTPRHQIGINLSQIEFSRDQRPSKIA
jgi:hypothetical protein